MTQEEYLAEELERLKATWDGGDFRAIPEAVALLSFQEPEWPEWLRSAVMDALFVAFTEGGARGKGKTGGHLVRARRADKVARRHDVAFFELVTRGPGATRDDAFERASKRLRGTFAQGTADAVKDSFYEYKRRLRKRT